MRAANPTPKSLMKNVDFTECFCKHSAENVKLHILHRHFLKFSLYIFFYSQLTPSLSLALPKSSSSAASPFFSLHHFSLISPFFFFSICTIKASTTLLSYISMSFLFFNPFLKQTNTAFWGSKVCVFHLYFFQNPPFSERTYI